MHHAVNVCRKERRAGGQADAAHPARRRPPGRGAARVRGTAGCGRDTLSALTALSVPSPAKRSPRRPDARVERGPRGRPAPSKVPVKHRCGFNSCVISRKQCLGKRKHFLGLRLFHICFQVGKHLLSSPHLSSSPLSFLSFSSPPPPASLLFLAIKTIYLLPLDSKIRKKAFCI